MRISLETVSGRWCFAFVLGLISAGSSCLVGKVWLAQHWSASPNPQLWLWAAELEPGNAGYWERLGLYAGSDIQHLDVDQAIAYLKIAAKINPRSDEIWADLASAYEELGRAAEAREAYQKAQEDYPISGEIAWRYGSFLLRQGDFRGGFSQIRRALAVEPSLTMSAVAESWEASRDPASITDQVLPAKSSYYLTALGYFLLQKQDDPALVVWKGLLKLGQPIEMNQTIPLVNRLISENHMSDAETTWREALQATNWPHRAVEDDSLVFNGGFEHEVANGGFGWREETVSGVTYGLDRLVTHSGKQSMRVTFDGTTNVDFAQLMQFVPVKPGEQYHFEAYLRTEDVTTNSGVRFSIYDPRHPSAVQILTPGLVGTNPWTPVETSVSTGPHTDLLVIALRRVPSQKFDNKLRGTAWIDDVSLVPVPSGQPALVGNSK
jgi:tetratricopeptide (TPR) repeat protein